MNLKLSLQLFFIFFPFCISAQLDSVYHQEAISLANQGELTEAIKLLDKAIKINPHEPKYFADKSLCLEGLGKSKESLECINNAVKKHPKNPYFLLARTAILYHRKDFKEVIIDVDNAMKFAKEDKDLKINLLLKKSAAHNYLNDFKSAISDLELALTIDSSYIAIYVDFGITYMDIKDYPSALKYFTKASEYDPNDYILLMNIGFLFIQMEEYRKAIGALNKSIQIEPNLLPESYNNRGFAYFKLGELETAEADIDKSLEMYPQNSYAHKNKALIYLAKKDISKACASLQKALNYGYNKMYGDEVDKLMEEYCK